MRRIWPPFQEYPKLADIQKMLPFRARLKPDSEILELSSGEITEGTMFHAYFSNLLDQENRELLSDATLCGETHGHDCRLVPLQKGLFSNEIFGESEETRRASVGHISLSARCIDPFDLCPENLPAFLGADADELWKVAHHQKFIILDRGSIRTWKEGGVFPEKGKRGIDRIVEALDHEFPSKDPNHSDFYKRIKDVFLESLESEEIKRIHESVSTIMYAMERYFGCRFGTGAAAIEEFIQSPQGKNKLSLKLAIERLFFEKALTTEASSSIIDRALSWMVPMADHGLEPTWGFASVVEVIPPCKRPLDSSAGQSINYSFQRMIGRSLRYSRIHAISAPDEMINAEGNLNQIAFDALIYNLSMLKALEGKGVIK